MKTLDQIDCFRIFGNTDNRGSFTKLFPIVNDGTTDIFEVKQVNLSKNTKAGTLRGIHFQNGKSKEEKIVICVEGRIYDVLVDIQADSPTFLHHKAFNLESDGLNALRVPVGFAHGFQTLEDKTSLVYLHSNDFSPEKEAGLNALDPDLQIKWPLSISEISNRDSNLPHLIDSKHL